jgi:hypothetical protein
VNFLRSEFVPRFVPNSGTLWSIPAHLEESSNFLYCDCRVGAS